MGAGLVSGNMLHWTISPQSSCKADAKTYSFKNFLFINLFTRYVSLHSSACTRRSIKMALASFYFAREKLVENAVSERGFNEPILSFHVVCKFCWLCCLNAGMWSWYLKLICECWYVKLICECWYVNAGMWSWYVKLICEAAMWSWYVNAAMWSWYVKPVLVGEGVDVVLRSAAFVQPGHGHGFRHVEGLCFLWVLGPKRHWSGQLALVYRLNPRKNPTKSHPKLYPILVSCFTSDEVFRYTYVLTCEFANFWIFAWCGRWTHPALAVFVVITLKILKTPKPTNLGLFTNVTSSSVFFGLSAEF